MVFENIEQLQRQWTDKFVVVDAARPELTRFSGMTGVVKTVNFSGRALVEFDANNNIGWFDIDPKFLKMIDAPPAKPAGKSDKKAAPAIVEKPAAAAKPATAKPAAAGASVADILAAARAGKAAAPAPAAKAAEPAAAPKKPVSTADILAAARGRAAAPTSTADILAAARGKAAPVAAPPPIEPEPVVEQAVAEPEPEAVVAESASTGDGPQRVDRSKMDVAAMVAYCRRVDAKG